MEKPKTTSSKLTPAESKEMGLFMLACFLLTFVGAIGIIIYAIARPQPGRLKRAIIVAVAYTLCIGVFVGLAFLGGSNKTKTIATNNPPAPQEVIVPVAMGIDKACALENNKKTLEVVGYFHTPDSISCYGSCNMQLGSKPKESKLSLSIPVSKSGSANTMDTVGVIYFGDDIPIRDQDKKEVDYKKPYKVTGILDATKPEGKDISCNLRVNKIAISSK